MRITEPMTMLTDYALGALIVWFAVRLLRVGAQTGSRAVLLWAGAFIATSIAAFAGGTYHGFREFLDPAVVWVIGEISEYAIGLASFFILASVFVANFSGKTRGVLLALAGIKFGVYAIWMASHDEFRYVIYDYAPTMVAILLIQVYAAWRYRTPGAAWIIAGIVTAFIAAGIQLSGFALHKHFNHNDLYHVVQMIAFYLLYRGGRLLRDRGGGPTPVRCTVSRGGLDWRLMKRRELPTWIRRPLGRMWRSRGGGYYGMGYVVSYFVLEIRMLVGDLQDTEGVVDFMTEQVFGFFVESFINAFIALAWPFLLVAEYELWGVGFLIAGYLVFERLIKPRLVRWFPADDATNE